MRHQGPFITLRGSRSLNQDRRQSVSTVGIPQQADRQRQSERGHEDVGIRPTLEGYSGHGLETVFQLQRQTTPQDRPRGRQRGGRGP